LLDLLQHSVDGVRERARLELDSRAKAEVEPALRAWMKKFDPKKAEHAHPLLEALWWHQRQHVRDEALLAAMLESPEPHARKAAAMVKQFWGPADPAKGKMPNAIADGPEKKRKVTVPGHLKGADEKAYILGADVFHREAHCATCHQENGKGLDPAFPTLIGTPWVTGSDERMAKIVLHGMHGKIEVNGKVYDPDKGVPPMTAFGSILKDEEIAAVLTYVRNSWGNKAAVVKPETVKKVRAATKDRSIFWKPEDLLKEHPLEK